MAPDGQVRLQASGIRLDHSVSEGEAICPSLTPSSFSLFAAGVTRRGCALDLELNSEGGRGGPTSVCSDQLFVACGGRVGSSIGVLDGRWRTTWTGRGICDPPPAKVNHLALSDADSKRALVAVGPLLVGMWRSLTLPP
jgi:hypothetical protein